MPAGVASFVTFAVEIRAAFVFDAGVVLYEAAVTVDTDAQVLHAFLRRQAVFVGAAFVRSAGVVFRVFTFPAREVDAR